VAPEKRIDFIKGKIADTNLSAYAAMIYSVDLMLGKIMSHLDALALSKNTLVIFTSDNGVDRGNLLLKSNKGFLSEGGIRVPYIVSWPGVIKAGTFNDEAIISYDIFPTLLAAGMQEQIFDRKSPLFWHFPHYRNNGPLMMDMSSALREGDWKYIYAYKTDKSYLYNLKSDLS